MNISNTSVSRCVNLDWLECYVLEDYIGYPHDAEYFRAQGFRVSEREYGTPVYKEMFTVFSFEDDQPLIEVRREPKSAIGKQVNGVLDPMAAHVRLTNRSCYLPNAAAIMQRFLDQYGFHFQRISRVDICLDFELFDYGDKPATFIDRYFRGKYAKINQANIRANGRDMWDGRLWNSVAWANPKSMVGTKFYNKTMELEQRADKPYIRQAWRAAGLVDDDLRLIKFERDGSERKVDVWRVEFSIKSSTRKWFVIEDCSGRKTQLRSKTNTLDMYQSKQTMLDLFFSLADHYFHFKRVEYLKSQRGLAGEGLRAVTTDYANDLATRYQADRKRQRKDRCSDKLLFRSNAKSTFYKLESVATSAQPEIRFKRLEAMLIAYREENLKPEVFKACNVLLEELERTIRTASLSYPWPASELSIIRLLISRRMRDKSHTLTEDIATMQALYDLEGGLFGETEQNKRT